jgi:hypothetical protein
MLDIIMTMIWHGISDGTLFFNCIEYAGHHNRGPGEAFCFNRVLKDMVICIGARFCKVEPLALPTLKGTGGANRTSPAGVCGGFCRCLRRFLHVF